MSYIDEDHKTRFDCLSPEEVIPVYSDDIEHILLYAIRMWQANDTDFWVEVMGDKEVRRYKAAPGYTSVSLFADSYHSFNQVPVSFLQLTKDCDGLCDRIFDLNDAYNSIISDSVDGEDAFADALLVLTGSFADEDDLSKLKKDRVLCLDEGSTAEYVTKDSSKSQSGSLLDRTETKIRELCAAPNFNDESFGTASGLAIRYKLIGMENRTSSYLAAFKMTLQKQIELISYVDSILTGEDAIWRDISIQFTRNLPVSETENAEVVAKLQGIVSDETLMTLLPFDTDPEEELKKVKQQRDENMELYQNNINNEDGDDELLAEQV